MNTKCFLRAAWFRTSNYIALVILRKFYWTQVNANLKHVLRWKESPINLSRLLQDSLCRNAHICTAPFLLLDFVKTLETSLCKFSKHVHLFVVVTLFVVLIYLEMVPCSPGWPQINYIAQDGLEPLIHLTLLPKCWDPACVPPCSASECPEI